MLYPSINELLTKVDNRYSLVVAVSKRARDLIEGEEPLIRVKEEKPVSIAVNEIDQSKIIATRPKFTTTPQDELYESYKSDIKCEIEED